MAAAPEVLSSPVPFTPRKRAPQIGKLPVEAPGVDLRLLIGGRGRKELVARHKREQLKGALYVCARPGEACREPIKTHLQRETDDSRIEVLSNDPRRGQELLEIGHRAAKLLGWSRVDACPDFLARRGIHVALPALAQVSRRVG